MGRGIGVLVAVGALVVAPALGYAAGAKGNVHGGGAKWTLSLTPDYTPSPWTKEVGYADRAGNKLVFGLKNTLLGWTEFFTEPKKSLDSGENFFAGLGRGLKNGLEEELGGVVHLVTFPVTALDAPLPGGGTTLL